MEWQTVLVDHRQSTGKAEMERRAPESVCRKEFKESNRYLWYSWMSPNRNQPATGCGLMISTWNHKLLFAVRRRLANGRTQFNRSDSSIEQSAAIGWRGRRSCGHLIVGVSQVEWFALRIFEAGRHERRGERIRKTNRGDELERHQIDEQKRSCS